MTTLQEFLNANPVDGLTDEVVVSHRFKGPDGALLKFKIRVMADKEFEAYRKQSMSIKPGKKKGQVEMDMSRFNALIVINHTMNPNFKDAASITALGCTTPEEYLSKVLLPGEIVQLAQEIQRLSGFDRDMDELVDDAKN